MGHGQQCRHGVFAEERVLGAGALRGDTALADGQFESVESPVGPRDADHHRARHALQIKDCPLMVELLAKSPVFSSCQDCQIVFQSVFGHPQKEAISRPFGTKSRSAKPQLYLAGGGFASAFPARDANDLPSLGLAVETQGTPSLVDPLDERTKKEESRLEAGAPGTNEGQSARRPMEVGPTRSRDSRSGVGAPGPGALFPLVPRHREGRTRKTGYSANTKPANSEKVSVGPCEFP